jgi:DNA-directed RNA polymerase specialized sigma24 family protein
LYKSAHDFVVDRLRSRNALKRKGTTINIDHAEPALEVDLHDFIADVEALTFVKEEVKRLERGEVREDCKKLLRDPIQTAKVLRMTMEGASNSAIADELRISTGTVSNRLQEGSAYLAKPLLTGTTSNRP